MTGKPLWDWDGPFGGLPPYDRASPDALRRDIALALVEWEQAVGKIADDPGKPTFFNTIEPLEAAFAKLRLVLGLFSVVAATSASAEMEQLESEYSAIHDTLDGKLAERENLWRRVERIHRSQGATLDKFQSRALANYRRRLIGHGALLAPADRSALSDLNARIAAASSAFMRNLAADESERCTVFQHEGELDGMDGGFRSAAAGLAEARGYPGAWAIANVRQVALQFLAKAHNRASRERVWREWTSRGENDGPHDNRPLMAEILRLRGQKARLMGFPNYAVMQLEDRMARTPETALDVLHRTWQNVKANTEDHFHSLQSISESDGLNEDVMPWDYYYYAEMERNTRFGLDAADVKKYLTLDSVIAAALDAAARLHNIDFSPIPDAPTLSPTIRPYLVSRGSDPVGLVYIDVVARENKRRGSWQSQVRPASSFDGQVLPVCTVVTSVEPAPPGEPVCMNWESANVIFHEFGHALHMLLAETRYPAAGSETVAWDMVELPALLNEQWLLDRALLRKHMRHAQTGEPIPIDMIEGVEAVARHERVFSTRASFLLGAIADLRLHMSADGRELDAVAVENEVRKDLGIPAGVDAILRMPQFVHVFALGQYASSVYVYLWGDVLAADVAEQFKQSDGGLYDPVIADRWRRTVLCVGSSVPADQAFRAFMGRDPDPGALMRRFEVASLSCGAA